MTNPSRVKMFLLGCAAFSVEIEAQKMKVTAAAAGAKVR